MISTRDYGQDQELAKQFLRDYAEVDSDGDLKPKYGESLNKLANRELDLLTIDLADLEKFNQELTLHVLSNTYRYLQLFYGALDELIPAYKTKSPGIKGIMDVFIEQRLFIAERNRQNRGPSQSQVNPSLQNQSNPGARFVDIQDSYPPDLTRNYEIAFKPPSLKATPIREVKAKDIGKLVTVRGIVTRATDVKPKITIVCYTCDQCGNETFQPVKGTEYTPLFECTSVACKLNKSLGRVSIQTRGSKFVKYQEIKLQEHSDQVPVGHIPRIMTVLAHGEQTRRCAAGDHISVSGIFLTVEKSNFRLRTHGLSADTYIEAQYITQMNKTEDDELNDEPLSNEEAIALIQGRQNFLKHVSGSIAPEIWGHEDLKIALLLLLVGGVDRNPDGMRVRGNINICLMGDPGVAKSQLLSFIDRLASRSQYTTGRGSSGVGLTAAVLKDPVTGELALEGGALVLADQGICCIDEFDKMMEADRTAIHEVMEQQTVSIAKAGIMTTLNARVSILAAANPTYGRYNPDKSIKDNIALPASLLSRFDLIWVILDQPNETRDIDLAQHITNIHTNPSQQPEVDTDLIDMKTMRRYINLCKKKNPIIPPELDDRLVKIYLNIRARKRVAERDSEDSMFTSPRSLLAIIRLSTAFARLRLSDKVEESDINEAVRIYECARETIEKQSTGQRARNVEIVYDLIRDMSREQKTKELSVNEVAVALETYGIHEDVFSKALDALERVETIAVKNDKIFIIS